MSPLDRELSAVPGREIRSWNLPIAIAGGIAIAAVLWLIVRPHGPKPPFYVFESQGYGCRFEFPSALTSGPNYVKSESGGILTIERYSLAEAKHDWVAALPEVLFPQVMIQLRENYVVVEETGRTPVTVDGRKGVEIVLEARRRKDSPETMITIVIFANYDWVWVLRAYSLADRDAGDRPLFRRVRETWKFLPEGVPAGSK